MSVLAKSLFVGLLTAVIIATSGNVVASPTTQDETQIKMQRMRRPCEENETVILGVASCFVFYCFEGQKEVFFLKSSDEWCINPPLGREQSCDIDGHEIESGRILSKIETGPKCGIEACMNTDIVFYEKDCPNSLHRRKDTATSFKKRVNHV